MLEDDDLRPTFAESRSTCELARPGVTVKPAALDAPRPRVVDEAQNCCPQATARGAMNRAVNGKSDSIVTVVAVDLIVCVLLAGAQGTVSATSGRLLRGTINGLKFAQIA